MTIAHIVDVRAPVSDRVASRMATTGSDATSVLGSSHGIQKDTGHTSASTVLEDSSLVKPQINPAPEANEARTTGRGHTTRQRKHELGRRFLVDRQLEPGMLPDTSDSEPERECEPLLHMQRRMDALKRRKISSPGPPTLGASATPYGVVSPGVAVKGGVKALMMYFAVMPMQCVTWLAVLREQYGTKLLLLLFSVQHVLKGIVWQYQAAAMMWVFREYSISGPTMQVYSSISSSAWALKPIVGMASDLVPIFGRHKAPYIIITSTIGVVCTAIVGFSSRETMGILGIVFCLFGMSLQASTCDLLSEAKYSEQLQEKPAFGPDLLTYVWGGINFGNIIAISTVGWLITNLGPRSVFLACIVPAGCVFVPTFLNFFEEEVTSREWMTRTFVSFRKQREVFYLCVLMFILTAVLTTAGVASTSHAVHFLVAVVVLVILLPSFHLVLRPEIAKVNTFFVLQAALGVGINGATFYFYTDKPDQYPEGPHFSPWFFTTTLGLVSSLMSLLGLATYGRYMKCWNYRSLILFCNAIVTVLSLLDVLMYTRTNIRLGIPDVAFVLGSAGSSIIIRQWQWMPGIVVMSQLCPRGLESTMFALLAGCTNIGSTISDYVGAFVLEELGVHPTGALNEGHQFANLWKASVIATMLPAVTLLLIPFLVPDALQTERLLLEQPSSATHGAPLAAWFAKMGDATQEVAVGERGGEKGDDDVWTADAEAGIVAAEEGRAALSATPAAGAAPSAAEDLLPRRPAPPTAGGAAAAAA